MGFKLLTHDSVLIRSPGIRCKGADVGDVAAREDRERSFHLIRRLGIRVVGEGVVRRLPGLNTIGNAISDRLEVVVRVPQAGVVKLGGRLLLALRPGHVGNGGF